MSIVWKNGIPAWNVTDTTAYPIEIKSIPIYVYLTPYKSSELKEVLNRAVAGYRREKRDVEIEREDRKIYSPLCDAHFVKLDNATGTPEQQRKWIDSQPELKPSLVELTFGGLRRDAPEDSDKGFLDITENMAGFVDVYQDLYDSEKCGVYRITMRHNYEHPSEMQYRAFRNARRNKYIQKRTLWTVVENHGALENLYDATIKSVSGMLVDNKECTESTKSEWIGSVPLWHKLWVVEFIFAELIEKNA